MIAHIRGTIFFRASRYLIIDVGGVGYKVTVSLETLKTLPQKNETCELFTYVHVRENALELYGFGTLAELEFFEMLISISGIGPKSALGILSVAPIDSLKRAIGSGDIVHLTKVSGIGKRTAEKIIVELRDKLAGGASAYTSEGEAEVIDALATLGYTMKEAREALQKVSPTTMMVDARLKEALKILGGKR